MATYQRSPSLLGGGGGSPQLAAKPYAPSAGMDAVRQSLEYSSSLSDFKIVKKIGEGAFSQVYRVIRISDNIEYALK